MLACVKISHMNRKSFLSRVFASIALLAPFALAITIFGPAQQSAHAQTIRQVVSDIDKRIEQHRKRDARLVFELPGGGQLPAGKQVQVELTRHAFQFGSMLGGFNSGSQQENETYRQRFLEAMNFATLIFIWEDYEKQPNQTRLADKTAVAKWCRERGVAVKGHNLVWNLEPSWVKRLSPDAAEKQMWKRVVRESAAFRGLVDTWDVFNESTESMYHAKEKSATAQLHALKRLGIPQAVRKSFYLAKRANPDATLLINDYETTEKYAKNIQACLDQGADIDVIGIQSHMHQGYWGAEKIWDVCNRFARFGKPIHFTELTVLSGRLMSKQDNDWSSRRSGWVSTPQREKSQADQVRETYRLLFSHPSVEAITWWDLSDRYAWMGAPGGLLREDFSPKPAYYVVRDLVKKGWHTSLSQPTDASGQLSMRGFYGGYAVKTELDGRIYRGRFSLRRDQPDLVSVRLEAANR